MTLLEALLEQQESGDCVYYQVSEISPKAFYRANEKHVFSMGELLSHNWYCTPGIRLPCPFCGSKCVTIRQAYNHDSYGMCNECGSTGPRTNSISGGEIAWNKRVKSE